MPPLPSQAELRASFKLATEKGIPHYSVILPEWTTERPTLQDTLSDEPKIKPKELHCDMAMSGRIEALRARYGTQLSTVSADKEVENGPNAESGDSLQRVPHPGSDFRHVDPGAFSGDSAQEAAGRKRVTDALDELDTSLKTGAVLDGELRRAAQLAVQSFGDLRLMLDPNPKGMQRLRLVFEWMLCQVVTLFGEINQALEDPIAANGKAAYNAAREKYFALLHDLDEREPVTVGPGGNPIPGGVRGYGRPVKWIYILPLIHGGKIKGTKVVAKWNPHISSAGIPIPHS